MYYPREPRMDEVLDKRQPDLTIILENVFDPHNVSAVMRSCDAVGIQEIFVVTSEMPRHKKWGTRSSSSAAKWLTVHQFDSIDLCLATVRNRYHRIFTTHLAAGSTDLYEMNFTEPIALVFGNEHNGCSPAMIAASDGSFMIPQIGMIQSLNISVACAVTIYEAFRQKRIAGHYVKPRLATDVRETLKMEWAFGERLKKES